MNKRILFAAVASLVAAPAFAGSNASATFKVPKGVTKLRVRSYRDGRKVIDTALSVQPGQTFTIDAVN